MRNKSTRGISSTLLLTLVVFGIAIIAGASMWYIHILTLQRVVLPSVKKPAILQPRVIGTSVEGRPIEVYTFGTGAKKILFVGGIHGGYEWNSVLLAYTFIDYFKKYPKNIPKNSTVEIIPSANPDGLSKITGTDGRFAEADIPRWKNTTGKGRFNAHSVDINRNFDCKWQPQSRWRSKKTNAGSSVFSEPESRVLRDFVLTNSPELVVFWHSQGGAVYASECKKGILAKTTEIMQTYAKAAGYTFSNLFTAYPVTGDAGDWLSSIGIPAITVELTTHRAIDWKKNLKAVVAILTV